MLGVISIFLPFRIFSHASNLETLNPKKWIRFALSKQKNIVNTKFDTKFTEVANMANKDKYGLNATLKLALAAVFAALVFVVTSQIPPIAIPATQGYFNFGETIIYIAALVAGALVGALAGGVGASLADVYLGFAGFAPGTLIIKGIEGAIVGFLNSRLRYRISNLTICAVISIVIGGLEMVIGYFLYEQIVLGYPFAAALFEVPFNLVQVIVGLIIAIPIMHAILRVFPQLKS